MCCVALLMQGWLAKRGPPLGRSWERRWCVLRVGGLLEYYADEACAVKKGTIRLQSSSCSVPFSAERSIGDSNQHAHERPFGFVLDLEQVEGRRRRFFYFDAGGAEAMGAWIAAITRAAEEVAVCLAEAKAMMGPRSSELSAQAAEHLLVDLERTIGCMQPVHIYVPAGSSAVGTEVRTLRKALARRCCLGARRWNLGPFENARGYTTSANAYADAGYAEFKEVLLRLGDTNLAVEVSAAHQRGAVIVALLKIAGLSSGMFGSPQKALDKPWISHKDALAFLSSFKVPGSLTVPAAEAAVTAAAAITSKSTVRDERCGQPEACGRGGPLASAAPAAGHGPSPSGPAVGAAAAAATTQGAAPSGAATAAAAEPLEARVNEESEGCTPRTVRIAEGLDVLDIELHTQESPAEGEGTRTKCNLQSMRHYFQLCKERLGLHVTTSCYEAWTLRKLRNGGGKVIPALPTNADSEPVRIFFFDDNLDMGGGEEHFGICNFRDLSTGAFVDFGEGKNGFKCDSVANFTLVHHSPNYRNVLVKANILDAMEDPEYFSKIVSKYSVEGEKLVLFMDVNSTIVCNDTVNGKDSTASIISTLCTFVELTPFAPFELVFDSYAPVQIDGSKSLKEVAKELLAKATFEEKEEFWTEPVCTRLLQQLAKSGDLRWQGNQRTVTPELFFKDLQKHMRLIPQVTDKDGITDSWFRFYDTLHGSNHTVVLNSFGVDTRKVVLATQPPECPVQQVTVNYSMWRARDQSKFKAQFEQAKA